MFFDDEENRVILGLTDCGFQRHPNIKNYMQKLYNWKIVSVMYYENMFVFDYFFKKEMSDDDADVFFPNIIKKVDNLKCELNTNQMGLDFVEGYIIKKYTKDINTLKLNELAMTFFELVEEELKTMNLA